AIRCSPLTTRHSPIATRYSPSKSLPKFLAAGGGEDDGSLPVGAFGFDGIVDNRSGSSGLVIHR
ncbi:MAG: hypothetical protein SQA66_14740, partial [Candidatus Fervidibacter sacchari]